MPGLVKLCGMRTPEDARAAIEAGADLIGLVFAPSRRRVSLEEARAICRTVRESRNPPRIVGLFVDAPVDEIAMIASALELDLVQLHGNEPPEVLARLGWPALKAMRLRPGESLEAACDRIAPYFSRERKPLAILLDAYHPSLLGGTGQIVDWTLAAELAARFPIILAGGLRPETVAEAIALVRPLGVDVSSGIERDGHKDPQLMQAFVAAARRAFLTLDRPAEIRIGGMG
jgi:phosphoribosylanthranilate isomerase